VPAIENACVFSYYQTRTTNEPLNDEEASYPFLRDKEAKEGAKSYEVATMDDERQMLREFRDFLVNVADPRIICGHNICGFDIPYLLDRAEALGIGEEFALLGVTLRDKTRIKAKVFSSKAFGSRVVNEFEIPGRLVLDTLSVTLRDQKLRSYSLNSLATEFLGETKADVPHKMISPLWHSGPLGRQRVAEYCLRDTDLTDRICNLKLMFIDKVEMARACGVPFAYILMRGQQVRVCTMLMRYALPHKRVIPFTQRDDKVIECAEKYKGATVLEPKSGFYQDPLIVSSPFYRVFIFTLRHRCFLGEDKDDGVPPYDTSVRNYPCWKWTWRSCKWSSMGRSSPICIRLSCLFGRFRSTFRHSVFARSIRIGT
jgi:DNA polymerase elongation subunit (family B)